MWFTPLACGPGSPQLSKSYTDMASKLFTYSHLQGYMRVVSILLHARVIVYSPL